MLPFFVHRKRCLWSAYYPNILKEEEPCSRVYFLYFYQKIDFCHREMAYAHRDSSLNLPQKVRALTVTSFVGTELPDLNNLSFTGSDYKCLCDSGIIYFGKDELHIQAEEQALLKLELHAIEIGAAAKASERGAWHRPVTLFYGWIHSDILNFHDADYNPRHLPWRHLVPGYYRWTGAMRKKYF